MTAPPARPALPRWWTRKYPRTANRLRAGDRLARYAAAFATAELNSSFYRWPRPSAFGSWRQRLPDGFRLSVKAPRGLTHGRDAAGKDVFVYFNNDGDANAVRNARTLKALLRQ